MIRHSMILACLAAAFAGSPAIGQDASFAPDSPPPRAEPPPTPPPAPPTAPPDQSPPSGAPADQGPPVTPLAPAPPVQAQPLQTLDLFSAGRDTGLGADLWKDSSAAIARAVIPTLADKPLSPAAVALARRVLATGATAPDGAGTDADLAAARARVLLALGDAPDAGAILDRTPGLAGDAALSRIAAEAALITDQPDKACRIGDALSTGRDGLYWLRLRAYCQVRQGKGAEAQLTFTIAGQEGADADYSRLMSVVLAGAGDPGAASLRDGLDYALSRQLQLDPAAPALADAPAAIAEHIRAALAPAWPPPAPPPAPLPPPGTAAPDHVVAPPQPSEADVLAALRAAKGPVDYMIAAKGQAPAIAALVQANAPLTAPVQLATAALTAGDLASAQAIRASLSAGSSPDASDTDLAILDAAVAVAADKPDPQTLDRLTGRGGGADGPDKVRAQAASAIYAPFGGDGPAARAAIAGFDLGGADGTAGEWLALDLAADARARGDVAMLTLSLAQTAGADGPTPAERVRLERALARAGFAPDARAFAIEGLVALESR